MVNHIFYNLRYIFISYAVLLRFCVLSNASQRQLSYSLNPNCTLSECSSGKDGSYLNIVHVQAVGESDTVHYVWSTYKVPTVLIIRTSKTSTLNINWDELKNFDANSISFSEEPMQSLGFILNQLWEFDDPNDKVDMNTAKSITSLGLADFLWDDMNNTLSSTEGFISTMPSSWCNQSLFNNNGTFKPQFSVSADDRVSDEYPHLWFTGCSSQFKIFLKNLHTSTDTSRFGAEFYAVSSGSDNKTWTDYTTKSVDDEYSPGVFKVQHLYSDSSSNKSFLIWKPVAYIGEKVTVANSSEAAVSQFVPANIVPQHSIAFAYFGTDNLVSVVSWNMTFGSSGDGFYVKTKFMAWSVMLGLGEPILDKMSMLSIIVVSVGLGAPLFIMIGGGAFLGYKKCKKSDDDLLLEG